MEDLNLVMKERLKKAEMFESEGIPLYPNHHRVPDVLDTVVNTFRTKTAEELEHTPTRVSTAGRIMAIRSFGKSLFMHLQ